jgi:hypothetical protein
MAAMDHHRAPNGASPTTDPEQAVVLPFPTQERRARRRRARAEKAARRRVALLGTLVEPLDVELNAEWDLLLTRAIQAWCWRDPDSIRTVEECLVRIKPSVTRDWS